MDKVEKDLNAEVDVVVDTPRIADVVEAMRMRAEANPMVYPDVYRKEVFAWFIEDCQWGPRSAMDGDPRAEVPTVEELEQEWRADHE